MGAGGRREPAGPTTPALYSPVSKTGKIFV